MLFNSAIFGVFLLAFFLLYWSRKSERSRGQNLVLILAGAVFYGSWDFRFLFLLVAGAGVDYFIASRMASHAESAPRRRLLYLSVLLNLGLLAYYKYTGFFAASLATLLQFFGMEAGWSEISILAPLGISYYTFQKLSYVLDVYRGQQEPAKDPSSYFAFMLFFPCLLSGPVERASNMLPQLRERRSFDRSMATEGLQLMLWGYFKKIVIADRLAVFINPVFDNLNDHNGASIAVAVLLFHLQLYSDFSGYSDIARGTARLFGISIINNFDRPYFAPSLRKYWRRWHISVSGWFNAYFFTPVTIATRNRGKAGIYFSILATFTVIGLWHGPSWTYVCWGLAMGLLICGEQALHKKVKLPAIASILLVNLLIVYCLIFFRSASMAEVALVHRKIFTSWGGSGELLAGLDLAFNNGLLLILFIPAILLFLAGDYYYENFICRLKTYPRPVRWTSYYFFLLLIVLLSFSSNAPAFVYFKF